MTTPFETVREALEAAQNGLKWYRDAHPGDASQADDEMDAEIEEALTALSELERMAVEPVAWTSQIEIDWAKRNPGRAGSFYAVKEGPSSLPLYAVAPPAQQPQIETDESIAADAYVIACEEMERWQHERRKAGKDVGTTGSLVDGIAWLYQYIHDLETKQAQAEAAPQWIECADQMPDPDNIVLAYYKNSHGFDRRIRAKWVPSKTLEASGDWDDCAEYDEESDCYYCPQGWYECMDNWDEFRAIAVHEGIITHWMPLPAAPQPKGGE